MGVLVGSVGVVVGWGFFHTMWGLLLFSSIFLPLLLFTPSNRFSFSTYARPEPVRAQDGPHADTGRHVGDAVPGRAAVRGWRAAVPPPRGFSRCRCGRPARQQGALGPHDGAAIRAVVRARAAQWRGGGVHGRAAGRPRPPRAGRVVSRVLPRRKPRHCPRLPGHGRRRPDLCVCRQGAAGDRGAGAAGRSATLHAAGLPRCRRYPPQQQSGVFPASNDFTDCRCRPRRFSWPLSTHSHRTK